MEFKLLNPELIHTANRLVGASDRESRVKKKCVKVVKRYKPQVVSTRDVMYDMKHLANTAAKVIGSC